MFLGVTMTFCAKERPSSLHVTRVGPTSCLLFPFSLIFFSCSSYETTAQSANNIPSLSLSLKKSFLFNFILVQIWKHIKKRDEEIYGFLFLIFVFFVAIKGAEDWEHKRERHRGRERGNLVFGFVLSTESHTAFSTLKLKFLVPTSGLHGARWPV